jgi:hypothetical protein
LPDSSELEFFVDRDGGQAAERRWPKLRWISTVGLDERGDSMEVKKCRSTKP